MSSAIENMTNSFQPLLNWGKMTNDVFFKIKRLIVKTISEYLAIIFKQIVDYAQNPINLNDQSSANFLRTDT